MLRWPGGAGVALAWLAAAAAACGSDTTAPGGPGDPNGEPPEPGLAIEVVAEGLDDPTHLTAPAGDDRLFVVERPGRIRIVRDGEPLPEPFLDIASRVGSGGSEQGLLSLAFHQEYGANGRFFVYFTDRGGDVRVEEFAVGPDPDRADPASARLVLSVAQPFANHNGGLAAFGPDGMLYLGLGDGGSGGDPLGNGQDPSTLLGSLLRIDVDGGLPYGVPPDNPFVGQAGARDEIWAIGLRNPWRFDFDPEGGLLLIADVGQSDLEEVNARPASEAGVNYGWNVMEGSDCFAADDCDREGLALPVLEYGHDEGCSVTGGHVYGGPSLDAVRGHYFYSDFCSGFLRSFRVEDGQAVDRRAWDVGELGSVLSFGEDAEGELYLLTRGGGRVLRLVEAP